MNLLLILALCCAAASPGAAPPPADGGADPDARDAYAGASARAFYDLDARIAEDERRIDGAGSAAAKARASLKSIRAFAAQQRACHGGELRDWDRETIAVRLQALEATLG